MVTKISSVYKNLFRPGYEVEDIMLKTLEQKVKSLDGTNLKNTASYTKYNVGASNFSEWIKFTKSLNDPDLLRTSLYYGFQPLYDCLVANSLYGSARPAAVNALNGIVSVSTAFLTSYYMGQPDMKMAGDRLEQIEPQINMLGNKAVYQMMLRNVDRNEIYPDDVLLFLKNFLVNIVDKKIGLPDYVIGCACGSSEIAMPLAGILETDVGFLRKSKRRYDKQVVMVKEQEPKIRQQTAGKNVVCIEDYVCTSLSISDVMKKTIGYNASSVLGASVAFSNEGSHATNFANEYRLKLFKFGDYPWK